MYAVIRRYNTTAGAADQIAHRVHEGFLPTLSKLPGFVAYYMLNPGDGTIASVSVFDDRASADESNRAASEWVKQNLSQVIRTAPVILTGEVVVHEVQGVAH